MKGLIGVSESKKMIIVLGMHRSGTSAITRGLTVLGVELGKNLLAGAANDNDKGYFEDIEIFNLNLALLESLEVDWKTSRSLPRSLFSAKKFEHLKEQAKVLLNDRLGQGNIYAFKDPRTVKLLPFWQMILETLNIEPYYLIAVRNPKSVVRSLASGKRGVIKDEKGYLLWLDHVLLALSQTNNTKRIVVEYDILLENPAAELARIATVFNLPFNRESEALRLFADEFLSGQLRHTKFSNNDLLNDANMPLDIADVYQTVQDYATDKVDLNDAIAIEKIALYKAKYDAYQPVFNYLNYLEAENESIANNRLRDHEYINTVNGVIKNQVGIIKQLQIDKEVMQVDTHRI